MLSVILTLFFLQHATASMVYVGYNRINSDNVYYDTQFAISVSSRLNSIDCIDACGQISGCIGVSIGTNGSTMYGGNKCILYDTFDPAETGNWVPADPGATIISYEIWKYGGLVVKHFDDVESNSTSAIGMLSEMMSAFTTSQSPHQTYTDISPKECVRVCSAESACKAVVVIQKSEFPDTVDCKLFIEDISSNSYVNTGTKKYINVVKATAASASSSNWFTEFFSDTNNIIIVSVIGIPLLSILINVLVNVVPKCCDRGDRAKYVVVSDKDPVKSGEIPRNP